MKKKLLIGIVAYTLLPQTASAHCPLCTAGAGALAVLAASIGVSSVIVGILIGAFALALSLWLLKLVKKKYVPFQEQLLMLLIFFGTVIPIMPLVREYGPLYLPFIGEYGSTYTVDLFILGVAIGALIVGVSPYISRVLTRIRGNQFPFQGLGITLGLLVVMSLIVQFLL